MIVRVGDPGVTACSVWAPAGSPPIATCFAPASALVFAHASSHRAGDTCHLDVADRFGNMVSATPSGGWLQSSPVIPGLGFCLGTRAQMFTLIPGLPATLAPGQRPRTTLSPSLALRDREPSDPARAWDLWKANVMKKPQ